MNGSADTFEAASQDWAPADFSAEAAPEDEPRMEAVAEPAAEEPATESEPESFIPEWAAPAAEETAEPAAVFDADSGLDLTAMAEAETETKSTDEPAAEDAPSTSGTGLLEGDSAGIGADRPRPHWLSVTRIGSRP
jgi:hypothetical protein